MSILRLTAVMTAALVVPTGIAATVPLTVQAGSPGSSSVLENLGGDAKKGFLGNNGSYYTGAGYTVVDIDGAFRKQDFLLGGKYVSEGCFGATPANLQTNNLCSPSATLSADGKTVGETGPGSSDPNPSCTDSTGAICHLSHGHLTASAAVGKVSFPVAGSTETWSGAAPDANLIALKVGSKGNWPEAAIDAAFRHVEKLAQSGQYKIAAVNLSNDGSHLSPAVPDSATTCSAAATLVNEWAKKLKALNIAVVVAAGNAKLPSALGPYACGDDVVAVGATKVIDRNQFTDGANGSNASSRIDLLAPVGDAGPGDKIFDGFQGTSVASPQVAGAFAVLRQRYPTETVDQLLQRMTSTGTPVFDTRPGNAGVSTPRLAVDRALNARGPRPAMDFLGNGKSGFFASNAAGDLRRWDTDGSGGFVGTSDLIATGWTASAHRLSTPVYDYAGPDTNGFIASVGTDLYYYPYDRAAKKLGTGLRIATNAAGSDVRAIAYVRDLLGPGTGGTILTQSSSTGRISTLTQQGTSLALGTSTERLTPFPGDHIVGVADVNADGWPDLIARSTTRHPVAYFGSKAGLSTPSLFAGTSRTVLATESFWSSKEQLLVLDQFANGKPLLGYYVPSGSNPAGVGPLVTFPFTSTGTVNVAAAASRWSFGPEWIFSSAPQR